MIDKEHALERDALVARLGRRRLQRRRRQRLPGVHRAPDARRPRRGRSPPTVRAIRNTIASSPSRSPASSACATRSSTPASSSGPEYRANPTNRCYYCKHELYTHLSRIAADRGAVIVDGNNADDRGDYRPGRQAAREFGVRSPLDEVDLTKDEIRELSRRAGLPTWDEPASACLSSRIPYHTEVTDEKLRTIERAEQALRALGFRVCRVRHHDDLARVEIARDEMPRALEPDMRRRDRARAESRGLSLRHPRSSGLPHRQPERGTVPAAGLSTNVDRRDRGARGEHRFLCELGGLRASHRPRSSRSLFLALHLPYLPTSLEDLDSINFALGVRQFDVAHHQPHPPGYPVYIALGKVVHAAVPDEARALGLLSIVAGALGVLALVALFTPLDATSAGRWAVAAVALAADVAAVLVHRGAAAQRHAGARGGARRPGADARRCQRRADRRGELSARRSRRAFARRWRGSRCRSCSWRWDSGTRGLAAPSPSPSPA